MARANKYITQIIYQLKKQYGQRVDLYVLSGVSQNPSTGNVTSTLTKHKLNKVPVLPTNVLRDFQYDLSFIAANKNFTYGGFYDAGTRVVLVDTKDLPVGYTPTLDNYFFIAHQRYNLKSYSEFDEARVIMFTLEEAKNQNDGEILEFSSSLSLDQDAENS
jgi:hypothetical protein